MFFLIVIAIFLVSILWSIVSLIRLLKEKEIKGTKEELAKGRVIFHAEAHEELQG